MKSTGFELGPTDRWFAATTHPNKEGVALLNLELQGIKTFLPRERRTVRHARKMRVVLAPIFRGYVFVALDTSGRWSHVNNTFGVRRLVQDGNGPIPVQPGVVETLIAATDAKGVVHFEPDFKPGDTVRLVLGPMAEQLGTILDLDEKGRIALLLDLFGRPVRTLVDSADVRLVSRG